MAADRKLTPIGYQWLAEHFKLDPIPHFVESFVATPGERKTTEIKGRAREVYPHTQYRLETVFDHLEFALKREGLHLQLLRAVLPLLPAEEVAAHVRATPTGGNARKIGWLFEAFSNTRLPVPDLAAGNYVDLADPEHYFTGPVIRQPRWRINQNLLGDIHFSPIVRRTAALHRPRDVQLHHRCGDLVGQVDASVYQRALRWLYAKETRTSYAIEHETPTQVRAERFMGLLARAWDHDFLTEKDLAALQNAIVDPRYAAQGWRTRQNYVGAAVGLRGDQEIHLVPPRPDHVGPLMEAWLGFARQHGERGVMGAVWEVADHGLLPPIAAAAVISWLFVYFHPFEDGNGRIHRFLIHHILARRNFGPPRGVLPVSAVLLNRPLDYDASLEVFSRPLKERSDYELDANGAMTVKNDTLDHFRYIDCTAMAEALYVFIEETIEKELPAEFGYLKHYDDARAAMRDIVDMPEPDANLLLRLCLQNQGRLSKTKRKLPAFEKLNDAEIAALERAIASAYGLGAGESSGQGGGS